MATLDYLGRIFHVLSTHSAQDAAGVEHRGSFGLVVIVAVPAWKLPRHDTPARIASGRVFVTGYALLNVVLAMWALFLVCGLLLAP